MRTLATSILLLVTVFAALPAQARKVLPFASFLGDYLEHGKVEIVYGSESIPSGVAKLRFRISGNGSRAKLKFHGTIQVDGADKGFSGTYLFKSRHRSQISNLAPGIDDGHPTNGTYRITAQRITAEFPFSVEGATGRSTLQVRLRRFSDRTQLSFVQTLYSSRLAHPITWTFSSVSSQ